MLCQFLGEVRFSGPARTAEDDPAVFLEQRDIALHDRLRNERLEGHRVDAVLLHPCWTVPFNCIQIAAYTIRNPNEEGVSNRLKNATKYRFASEWNNIIVKRWIRKKTP